MGSPFALTASASHLGFRKLLPPSPGLMHSEGRAGSLGSQAALGAAPLPRVIENRHLFVHHKAKETPEPVRRKSVHACVHVHVCTRARVCVITAASHGPAGEQVACAAWMPREPGGAGSGGSRCGSFLLQPREGVLCFTVLESTCPFAWVPLPPAAPERCWAGPRCSSTALSPVSSWFCFWLRWKRGRDDSVKSRQASPQRCCSPCWRLNFSAQTCSSACSLRLRLPPAPGTERHLGAGALRTLLSPRCEARLHRPLAPVRRQRLAGAWVPPASGNGNGAERGLSRAIPLASSGRSEQALVSRPRPSASPGTGKQGREGGGRRRACFRCLRTATVGLWHAGRRAQRRGLCRGMLQSRLQVCPPLSGSLQPEPLSISTEPFKTCFRACTGKLQP